ncbi:serine/threonine-protein kinase 16 [Lingula anatina]|uniref:non-specific serine/threonine protein kinase n=1 Tax=Lingula anatina TaxID=7574 RepID=A0A1S3HUL0_LINAN|nr:serine/threonine-protein kinase 16 [Lingula anatina]|eukprot:XP_013389730.1 serine/threonine-protein kinase 16 [Lingula anatina]
MNAYGLSILLKMGCVCGKESIRINNEKYFVRSRLGEGGFSVVDLVEHTRSHRKFALKRIQCHSKEDERDAMREVEICQDISHPNIIKVEDHMLVPVQPVSASSARSELLVLLPFFRRGTLQDEIERMERKHEHIPESRIIKLFTDICEAVRVLHHHQPHPIAHRDLKPGNLMLADDGTVVLMDFGSAAKARVEINGHSQALALQDLAAERCSMPYRAPELFNIPSYSTIDEKTDIWSLGCVLYALAYLKSPFDEVYQRGDSIALAVGSGNIRFPQDETYSQELRDLILFMLQVEHTERPNIETVIARLEALRNVLENRI